MQVILKEKVGNLGDLGEIIKVKSGYARNYLVPKGKAVQATKLNIASFEKQKKELLNLEQNRLEEAKSQAAKIDAKRFEIKAQAGDEGKLFGSIGTKEIANLITEAGIEIEKRQIRMPEGVIRQIGEYEITVHLYTDVDVVITVAIISD